VPVHGAWLYCIIPATGAVKSERLARNNNPWFIFHSFDGHPLFKHRRRPPNLEPKVKFFRECFNDFPQLAQFKAESEVLFTRFSAAATKRNDLVHGAIATTSAEDGTFIFLKIDVKPTDHHSIRSVFLDDSDWTEFRRELLHLGKDGQSLAQRVWDALKEHT